MSDIARNTLPRCPNPRTGHTLGKFCLRLLMLVAAVIVSTCQANAQGCPDPWGSASNVFATLYLEGSGSASSGPYTQSVNQSITMMALMPQQQPSCFYEAANPGGIGVVVDSVTLHDQFTDSEICGGDPPIQYYYWDALGDGTTTSLVLGITPTLDVYGFGAGTSISGIFKEVGCVNGSINQDIVWGPLAGINEQFLPFSGEAQLAGNISFRGSPADTTSNLPANWNLAWSFSPIPDTDCEDCNKSLFPSSGSDLDVRSQSLGEDIPLIGTPFFLHYDSLRAPGHAGADAVAINDARGLGGWTLSVHHAIEPLLQMYCMGGSCTPYAKVPKALFLGDGSTRTDDTVQAALPFNGNLYVAAEDGSEIYVFDAQNRHIQTVRPMTGAVHYSFAYDAFNRLTTITDDSNNVTTIQRDANENATAIVGPFGQQTTLTIDSNGFLTQVTDPAGHVTKLGYSSLGLLTSLTDPKGNVYQYEYDTYGRLTKHSDPAGGWVTLARTDNGDTFTVAETTAAGRSASYQVGLSSTDSQTSRQFTNTLQNGLQATESKTAQAGLLSESAALPGGTAQSTTSSPDPRWGIQVPVATSESVTVGNLTMNLTGSRSVSLNNPGDPFSLNTQTDTTTVNGRVFTRAFTASNRTYVNTTPVGRKMTETLDAKERISSIQVAGLAATQFSYNPRGFVTTVKRGPRKASLAYDTLGRLKRVTDPLGQVTSFTYDGDARQLSRTLPDGREIQYAYDANDNLTSLTPPGEQAHTFAFTALNFPSSYTPPSAPGSGATSYSYNADGDLTTITRPDGETINYNYDTAGRLSSVAAPTEAINYSYDATTGILASESVASGEQLTYGYNGTLVSSTAWNGTVAGSVGRSYNNNFWTTSQTVNNGNNISFTYDDDGLLTQAGQLALTHNAQNGLLTATSLGPAKDVLGYNPFGELIKYAAKYKTTALYSVNYTRDALGRVTSAAENIQGTSNTWGYSYDSAGRLTGVTQNGASVATYTYDSNSNRLTVTTPNGSVNGSYDAQDRLVTYGNTTYTYTANGELASMTIGSQTTTYQYDVLGNLVGVILPDGTDVTYIVDAENRRVGKLVNGVLTAGFLYDGDNLVAQLDGSNQVVSQFVYGSGSTVPDYMVKGSVKYRIFSDQLGSPRLVVNASNGQVAQRMDYDEFGNVINNTNPGFQPFGYAGGLYDQDTKMVRFGARDYDASTGRWTAKDPLQFAGGDSNLYGYVLNDPINRVDPAGLEGCACPRANALKALGNYASGFLDGYVQDLFAGPLAPSMHVLSAIAGAESSSRAAVGAAAGPLVSAPGPGEASGLADTGSTAYIAGYVTEAIASLLTGEGLVKAGKGVEIAEKTGAKAGKKCTPLLDEASKGIEWVPQSKGTGYGKAD